jgi:hypothetical protein
MKINVLSLEDLTENQTDVVVDADLPEEEIQNLRADATAQEEEQAAEDQAAEEQTESQSLIDQVVALEALYEKIAGISEFPIELAMEAYDAAPDAYIMDTYRSGASTSAKISVAMEGIAAKAWEAVKRFWGHLVTIWKKFVQYVDRLINGKHHDELVVTPALAAQLESIVHEAQQRYESNQHKGILLRDNPEQDSMLKQAYFQSGSGKGPELIAKVKTILPKCNQFIGITEKYLRELESWAQNSTKHPEAHTVLPANPESTMYDFVEGCAKISKLIKTVWLREESTIGRVPLSEVLNGIKASVIHTEYGIERRLVNTALDILSFIEKRQKEVERISKSTDTDNSLAKIYRVMGAELGALRSIVNDAFMLFSKTKHLQKKLLALGYYWIWAIELSYKAMTSDHSGSASAKQSNYSVADKKLFADEREYFGDLMHKYRKETEKLKLFSTII